MSDQDCFEPLSHPVITAAPDSAQWSARQLFYRLMQGGDQATPLAYHWLLRQFKHAGKAYQHQFISYQPEAQPNLQLTADCPVWRLPGLALLQQAAPVWQTEAEWLVAASKAATNDHPIAAQLLAAYLQITDGVDYRQSIQGLLLAHDLACPPMSSWAFTAQTDMTDSVFALAAAHRALAYCPRVFMPELLGFALAWCQTQGIVGFTVDDALINNALALRHSRLVVQHSALVTIMSDYLQRYPQHKALLWQRLQTGFCCHQYLLDCCRKDLQDKLAQVATLADKVGTLFAEKAVAACGHHRALLLGGRPIDHWFAQSPFDSLGFMQALLNSPYIDPINPKQSRLLKLFGFGGPMFGVLSAQEVKQLENWLVAGGQLPIAPQPDISAAVQPVAGSQNPNNLSNAPAQKLSGISNRQLFYYLVNADLYPEVSTLAKNNVKAVLRMAAIGQAMPFKHYSPSRLQAHFNALYQREIQSYQAFSGSPKLSKQAYLWGIGQLAPTILVDGCWLQNYLQLNAGYPMIAKLLGKIYQDELGSGKLNQNHPLIYRQLLESQAMALPPIHSTAFIGYQGFLDSAFDLPVYLLAISQLPREFLPELLGLNMAIELSGLGKVYLSLADELAYWGIDPAIVNLHTTIDNIASGHAALAQQAIVLYLDAVAAEAGEAQVQQHWRRVYTGYCSLQAVVRWFKVALVGRYLVNRSAAIFPHQFFKPHAC